ncbi:MAG: hypothetical protein JHC84_15885, partial [Solirubrobacteraceae bacterium]|nr:hypothetical protein [Solirubrobacteraceae bacterium]
MTKEFDVRVLSRPQPAAAPTADRDTLAQLEDRLRSLDGHCLHGLVEGLGAAATGDLTRQ